MPADLAPQRYAGRFSVVANDRHERDHMRVLDFGGAHAFQLFRFAELGAPISHGGPQADAGAGIRAARTAGEGVQGPDG